MPGNPTNFWTWPAGKEAEAAAYAAAADADVAILLNEPPMAGLWSPVRTDAHGQPVVAKYYGGPWQHAGAIIPEGPTEAALRVNAVEVEDWDRPPEEEPPEE